MLAKICLMSPTIKNEYPVKVLSNNGAQMEVLVNLNMKPLGLTDQEAKRFRQLNGLLQIIDCRTDMLTYAEREELRSIIMNVQAGQGEIIAEGGRDYSTSLN
jgi:hypothetical protein